MIANIWMWFRRHGGDDNIEASETQQEEDGVGVNHGQSNGSAVDSDASDCGKEDGVILVAELGDGELEELDDEESED